MRGVEFAGRKLPVVRPLLFGPLQTLVHSLFILTTAFGAIPFPFGLVVETHTREVEPLDGALVVIAADHLTVGDLLAQAICGLVRVDGQVCGRRLSLLFGL